MPTALKTAEHPGKERVGRPRPEVDLLLLRWVKRGLERGKVTEKDLSIILSNGRAYSYDNDKANNVASDIIKTFTNPPNDVVRKISKQLGKMDSLVKEALLLREDVSESLKKNILNSLPSSLATKLEYLLQNRESAYSTPKSMEDSIIKQFKAISDGKAGTIYKDWEIKFVVEARDELFKGMNQNQSEYLKLAASIPKLKLNPTERLRDGSPCRGVYHSSSTVIYEGKETRLYHAGPPHTNLRAFYVIVGDGKSKTIVITGIGYGHD